MYRRALALRRALQRPDATVTWLSVDDRELLHFRRAGGWECFVNFGTQHKPLPGGEVLISSGLLDGRTAPPESTTWLRGVCDEYRAP
jgi:alpha-glucosidase